MVELSFIWITFLMVALWIHLSLVNSRNKFFVSIVLALLSFWAFPYVIEQNFNIEEDLLPDKVLLQNIALFQIIESLIFLQFQFFILKQRFEEQLSKSWLTKVVKLIYPIFPGWMVFLAVIYAQLQVFIQVDSLDFTITALMFSFSIPIVIISGTLLLRYALPSFLLRIEMAYYVQLILILLAAWLSAATSGEGKFSSSSEVSVLPMLALLFVFLATAQSGYFIYKYKLNKTT